MRNIERLIKKIVFYFYTLLCHALTLMVLLVKVVFFSGFFSRMNMVLKKGNTCYILGNGPSLKIDLKSKISSLYNENVFVVNDFALSELFEVIKPNYYVLADPSYWSNNTYSSMFDIRSKVYNEITRKVNWELFLLIPYEAYKTKYFQNVFKAKKNIHIVYFNTVSVDSTSKYLNLFYKYNLAMPKVQNVLVASIFSALNIGFKEIFLYGADHSWTQDIVVNSNNEVCLIDKHFYDNDIKYKEKVWLNFRGKPYKLHEVLHDLSKMFKGYHDLEQYSIYLNARIINNTSSTFIDAFCRNK